MGRISPRGDSGGEAHRRRGLVEDRLHGAIDHRADVVVIEPQTVGLPLEIGLATHGLAGTEARSEADAEDIVELGAVVQQKPAIVSDSILVAVGLEHETSAGRVVYRQCRRAIAEAGNDQGRLLDQHTQLRCGEVLQRDDEDTRFGECVGLRCDTAPDITAVAAQAAHAVDPLRADAEIAWSEFVVVGDGSGAVRVEDAWWTTLHDDQLAIAEFVGM